MPATIIAPKARFVWDDEIWEGELSHDPSTALLEIVMEEESEVLSVDLMAYGLVPAPGCVYVKDWSEHSGLADALETAGLGQIQERVVVGPMDAVAYELRVAGEEVGA